MPQIRRFSFLGEISQITTVIFKNEIFKYNALRKLLAQFNLRICGDIINHNSFSNSLIFINRSECLNDRINELLPITLPF
jgi:hypothetical protein